MSASFLTRVVRVCTSTRRVLQLVGKAVVLLVVFLPLFSQSNQGTVQGGVFDQTGGAIAGATVTVIDVARGVTRALTTDNAGEYVAPSLLPGTYTVRAEAKGFRTVEHSGVLVDVGKTIRVDLTVQPGEQTQTVTVTGEIPEIDTTDSTLGGTVSNAAINALPLNGRNFERLLQLLEVPAVQRQRIDRRVAHSAAQSRVGRVNLRNFSSNGNRLGLLAGLDRQVYTNRFANVH